MSPPVIACREFVDALAVMVDDLRANWRGGSAQPPFMKQAAHSFYNFELELEHTRAYK